MTPRGQAESHAHFLRILHPFTQACGPKVDSPLGSLMPSRVINPPFWGPWTLRNFQAVSVISLGSGVFLYMTSMLCVHVLLRPLSRGKNVYTCSWNFLALDCDLQRECSVFASPQACVQWLVEYVYKGLACISGNKQLFTYRCSGQFPENAPVRPWLYED